MCSERISCIYVLSNSKPVFSKDEIEIVVKYDGLLKIEFSKIYKKEKMVVIAVNQCSYMIISQGLIKINTGYGQFLQKFVTNKLNGEI